MKMAEDEWGHIIEAERTNKWWNSKNLELWPALIGTLIAVGSIVFAIGYVIYRLIFGF